MSSFYNTKQHKGVKGYTVSDFLTDDSFWNFVFKKSKKSVDEWENFLKIRHSKLIDIERKAQKIILFENEDRTFLQTHEFDQLKQRILHSIQEDKKSDKGYDINFMKNYYFFVS